MAKKFFQKCRKAMGEWGSAKKILRQNLRGRGGVTFTIYTIYVKIYDNVHIKP